MTTLVAKRFTAGASLLVLTLFSLHAVSQGVTKFRGLALNQSIDEVQKIMTSLGFKPKLLDDPQRRWEDAEPLRVMASDCGSARFKNGRAVELRFSPCYFRMDSRTTSKDLAQAMVNNFPIQKMDIGSRLEPGLTRAQRVTYYYGRLKTGEKIEIPIEDSPEVVVAPGETAGGPVFK